MHEDADEASTLRVDFVAEEIWDQTLTPKRSLISHLHSVCPFRQASFLKGASRIFSKPLALAHDLAAENECFQRVLD